MIESHRISGNDAERGLETEQEQGRGGSSMDHNEKPATNPVWLRTLLPLPLNTLMPLDYSWIKQDA